MAFWQTSTTQHNTNTIAIYYVNTKHSGSYKIPGSAPVLTDIGIRTFRFVHCSFVEETQNVLAIDKEMKHQIVSITYSQFINYVDKQGGGGFAKCLWYYT